MSRLQILLFYPDIEVLVLWERYLLKSVSPLQVIGFAVGDKYQNRTASVNDDGLLGPIPVYSIVVFQNHGVGVFIKWDKPAESQVKILNTPEVGSLEKP